MANKIQKEVYDNQEIYKLATNKGINIAQARQEYYGQNDALKETAVAATRNKTSQPTANVITKKTSPATKTTNYSVNPYSPMYGNRKNLTAQGDAGLPTSSQAKIREFQKNWMIAAQNGDEAGKAYWHSAAEAERSKFGYLGGDDGSGYFEQTDRYGDFSFQSAPVFFDAWGNQIADQQNKILNRKAFSYNLEEDPLYAVYKAQYNREGDRATQNTIGEVSARTGGLASSYASTAAAQAGQYYAQQLADKIPELQQLAYSMYMDDLNADRQDLAMLERASDRDYGRFMDAYGMWSNDRDFAYGNYRNQVADDQWQTTYDRGVLESDRSFKETQRMNNFGINSQAQGNAQERIYNMIVNGGLTAEEVKAQAPELFEVSGLTDLDLAAYETTRREALAAQRATSSGSSGGGGGSKPVLTANQAMQYYGDGSNPIKTEGAIQAYEYYSIITPEEAQQMRGEIGSGGGTTGFSGNGWDAIKASYAQDGLILDMGSISAVAGPVTPEQLDKMIERGEVAFKHEGNVVRLVKSGVPRSYGNVYPWSK